MGDKLFGKYRGVVEEIGKGEDFGKLKARLPRLSDMVTGWASPCLPFAGKQMGFFAMPADQAGVWIEFEEGDVARPIWSGCYWNTADGPTKMSELPPELDQKDPTKVVLIRTSGGHSLLLDDDSSGGGITIKTSGGQHIKVSSESVEIVNGQEGRVAKIELKGPKVAINVDGLEVT